MTIFSFCPDFIRKKNKFQPQIENYIFFISEKNSKVQISATKNQQGREEGRVILKVASKSLKIEYIVV